MQHQEARERAITLVEQALAILDEASLGGPAANFLDHALALLRVDDQAVASLKKAGFAPPP